MLGIILKQQLTPKSVQHFCAAAKNHFRANPRNATSFPRASRKIATKRVPPSPHRNQRQTAVANGSGKSVGENAYAVAHEMQYKVVFLIHSLLSEAATFSALECLVAEGVAF